MLQRIAFVFAGSLLALVGSAAAPLGAGDSGKALKYQFKSGETYVYLVTIVADRDDATETIQGHVQLAVKSVEPNTIRLTPSVSLPRKLKSKTPGRFPGPPVPVGPPSFIGARELSIDTLGNVLRSSGDTSLSYLLGSAARLVIEPLSPDGKKRWERSTDVVIREIQNLVPFARFGPRSETDTAAREVLGYEIVGAANDAVRIKKTLDLKTLATEGDAPRIQLQGAGEMVFDPAAGLMKSLDFKATLTLNDKNTTVRVPITVTHRLLTAAEAAAYQKEQEENRATALAAAKLAAAPQLITDAELAKALTNLKSSNPALLNSAADKLAKSIPIEARRNEVASQLEGLLKSDDGFQRAAGAKGLKTWGSAKHVPVLIALLKDENHVARHAAFEALGALKDEKGAEAVAGLLSDPRSRFLAANALKTMGPVAAKSVAPLLKHQDWAVRMEAARVLGEIGGKESVPALKAVASDSNQLVAREAGKAIKAIEGR
jgi:hypothetical protein